VRKLAYITPPGMLEKMMSGTDEYKRKRGFEEGYFGSEAEALGWLSS